MKHETTRYCTRCATPLASTFIHGRVRPACPACGFVVYLDPKVACAALIARDNQVLLVRRRYQPGQGLWCLPCGFADADEPPERTVEREVAEECAVQVAVGSLLGAYHYLDDPRGAGILLVYQAQIAEGRPQAGDDADDVGFFALDDLPPLSHSTHQRALADWRGQQGEESSSEQS